MDNVDGKETFCTYIKVEKKIIKEILMFFSIYFQQVILFIKKDKIVFFNNEDETKISLFISLPYNNLTENEVPQIPYIFEIKKILILITSINNDRITMKFTERGYGMTDTGTEHKYYYFTNNNLEKIRDFQIDNKIVSEFNITDQFNTFFIYSKIEERINFKLYKDSIMFYFQNEIEENNLQYPLHNSIDTIEDIQNNSYSIHILYLKFISKISKLSKKTSTIKGNILCDADQREVSSIRVVYNNSNYEIKVYSKIMENVNNYEIK